MYLLLSSLTENEEVTIKKGVMNDVIALHA